MLDIGWTELLIVGVVALIVVGPKDLPGMFRTLGRFTGRLRGMAREFQRAMDDAARETGVKDVAADLKKATSPRSMGLDALNAAADRFEKWDPIKGAGAPKPPGGVSGSGTATAGTATAGTATAGTATAGVATAAAAAGGAGASGSGTVGPATAALAEERKSEAQAIMAANAARAAARKSSAAAAAPRSTGQPLSDAAADPAPNGPQVPPPEDVAP